MTEAELTLFVGSGNMSLQVSSWYLLFTEVLIMQRYNKESSERVDGVRGGKEDHYKS